MGVIDSVKSALHSDSKSTGTNASSANSNSTSGLKDSANSGSHSANSGTTRGSALSSDEPSSTTTGASRMAKSSNTKHQSGKVPMDSEGRLAENSGKGHTFTDDERTIDGSQAESHSHQMLAHKTHENIKQHEVEEVTRERQHDRHIHHVQHTTQPIYDERNNAEQHERRSVPVTQIKEGHATADADKAAFAAQVGQHSDRTTHSGKDRQVIDKGERLTENTHHHVHNVVQPIIERDVHQNTRIHTTIPVSQETHEAPIVHQSQDLKPISMSQFKSQGNELGKGMKPEAAGSSVLDAASCERTVAGNGEAEAQKLLGHGTRLA
ncbi:uncharacterized protein L969DRAFT_95745 [Mixia osmundae IAM 14324]|uniref:Allergen n=1 Tax=Mixia osmundae (strain CBS 9802 / IAM 14324 / JCM 22182 / KY 12970) TaxID=764103 RepID=G7E0Q7_MIXOS|nr:uncharacterized protein L969DRAFT_95745 [Mixia osmundae IAM 14324]KEI37893.1 hypothetical protein L969DRAFT_95745 [Mixia osmundae IAM 14324]GAA96417.1 hypothetical protein E5Q_03084 [Mixia osmundae IAM 14324]